MTDIKPMMVGSVGYCSVECPHHFVFYRAHFCKLIDYEYGDLDCNACPIHARRVAEERDRLLELAQEAKEVLELAVGVPDNTIQIMRQEGLKIEDLKDPMQKLAFTIHTEACEIANKAEVVLDRYPGKDGE